MTKPVPTPGPRPSAVPAPQPRRAAAPVQSGLDHEAVLARAKTFGRADESGTVYRQSADGEVEVGQYPNASPADAVEYFAKKFVDLAESAALLAARLGAGASGKDIKASALALRDTLREAAVVGNVAALDEQLVGIAAASDTVIAAQAEAAEAARAQAVQAREKLVVEAEEIAATDPARMQWKQSGQRLNSLFDEWKAQQRTGVKISRSDDQALWQRFSAARATFDKHRREFFSQLDKRNAEGKRAKEAIVAEAEELSSSTDWKNTALRYRDLMSRWKAAPRAARKDDDALWARFRAAQDVFFHARQQENDAIDASYAENLKVKEELLAQAQALLPIKDIAATRKALRVIQDQWEDAGRVPRADVSRVENGLRDVEQALAAAEDDRWQRTNPETQARTSGVLAQLDESLAELRAKLDAAVERGDETQIAAAREALATRQAWRDQLAQTASELG